MMQVGDELKKLRQKNNLSQRKMVADVMDHSAYARVEANKSKIGSNNFINIFQKNNFSIVDFMKNFGDTSFKNKTYQDQVMLAYLYEDKETLEKIATDTTLNISYIKWAIELMLERLNGYPINQKLVVKLKNTMLKIDDWDENSLWILLVIMSEFEFQDLKSLVDSIFNNFEGYAGKNIELINVLASVAVAYLEICQKENCDNSKYKKAIKLLKNLPAIAEIFLQKMMGIYYEAMLNGNQKLVDKITNFLEEGDNLNN
ncbi:helix-turn-helix transcriptional regulator [Lactobacillus sp.]|uniref:helix-turn-helix domain-containing protein n=1 Tax=Lactobacillus sp. TaxID=1591 RepID=UPI0019A1540C|nr:helix-turn-helix transcriptional regulator [Lactobacillus sp.]MBD5430451.1 helix-turn-helix transcriptional regulator [Lactobacillus sp.]